MNINHVDNYATASWHWLVLNAEREKEKEVEKCVMTTYRRRKCRGFANLDISVLDIEGKMRK